MKDPYIEIAYENDGRVVEGQCSGLLRFVVSERAKCRTKADEATLRKYMAGLDEDELEAVKVAAEKLIPHGKRRTQKKVDDRDDEEAADEVDETADTEAEEDSDGEVDEATDDNPKDGWPSNVDVDQKGAYYDLHGSDGNRIVNSESPSGKWQGENAAQEAAWKYENALTAEG